MKPTDFAIQLTAFLNNYLPGHRNVSPNTIKSYRDTFSLFLNYCRNVRELSIERLDFSQIDTPLILSFLDYLETERHCKARTRNQRLAAIHSFFRFVQSQVPEYFLQCQQILAIPSQRYEQAVLSYLSIEDLGLILKQPDLTTPRGRRDAVLLSLLYDTGTRVQELIDLSVQDVRLEPPAQVRVRGKGRKVRVVPLMEPTVQLLGEYMRERGLDRPERIKEPLFAGPQRKPLSRSGIRYILDKYTKRTRTTCPGLSKNISPHTLRHSKAMHLLECGNPLPVISRILGHSDTKATEVYAKANLKMMHRALENAKDFSPSTHIPSWKKDNDLMDWLRSL